ncbi:pyridoxal phosphate-dependent aminotransferase [Nocardia brevicatena]|uniref:pyridoxal phosphate-dependent aminotransferase n=1 Tax=Nocardia brevicatena TaxID=37327 RepID=UPI0005931645|nr:aminotransferase class I/II-fold pyridoxal phosphate-dependent enzyme [Nocardia brevicatena]
MTHAMQLGHRLQLNENPYGPPPSVHNALTQALASANRYPEFLPQRLPRLIADRLGCAPEAVMVGAGATGVITHIMQEMVTPGATVVMAAPTFEGYPILARMTGGQPIQVPLTIDGRQDLTAMASMIDEYTRLVVVCSPHNPTGTRVETDEFSAFVAGIDPAVTVVLDEAYVDFVTPQDRVHALALLQKYPNLLVLRTFSKAYGLAALRVGYAVGAPETIKRIARWQVPFGMNALAEVGVQACYAAEPEIAARVAEIDTERRRLIDGLRRLRFAVPDSVANFVYLTPPEDTTDTVGAALAGAGILVKHYPTGIRITVGDAAATDAVLNAVRGTIHR